MSVQVVRFLGLLLLPCCGSHRLADPATPWRRGKEGEEGGGEGGRGGRRRGRRGVRRKGRRGGRREGRRGGRRAGNQEVVLQIMLNLNSSLS